MNSGKKCTTGGLHTTVAARRRDRDKNGQDIALVSQAEADPGPDTRPHEIRLAGMQPQQSFAMSAAFRVHGSDDAHPVSLPGKMRQQFAHPDSAFAMLRELERRPQQCAELIAIAADRLSQKRFAGFGVEPRFGIEEIDVIVVTRIAPATALRPYSAP